MDEQAFWKLIDSAVSPNQEESDYDYDKLEDQLREFSPEGVLEFAAAMQRVVDRAYDWKLWGAADLIHGGCSDDAFEYFRGWLIAQGSEVYRQALANPDSLADYLETYQGPAPIEDEDILAIPYIVFQEMTGSDDGYETGVEIPEEPTGVRWNFDSEQEMQRRLPKLAAMGPFEGNGNAEGEEEEDEEEGR